MGDHSYPNSGSVISANHELLASVLGCSVEGAQEAAVHHYTKSFRGFSAMLTPEQARLLSESESVVSIFESREHHLHTTHSWEFLGVDSIHQYNNLPIDAKPDLIIGVIDSGIWPESESFNDRGLGPVPKRFKGKCVPGQNFTVVNCNSEYCGFEFCGKIIGARYYWKGFETDIGPLESFGVPFFQSARDENGHGTHTASTAAGSEVSNASLFGIAAGVARGGAPTARLSIYKACWLAGRCSDADLLSAIDDAIDDGVDIISLSVGGPNPTYFVDATAIGAFHAFKKGILFSASAGNEGVSEPISNGAPWILTVTASTVDREFRSDVYLGNSKVLKGYALNPFKMERYNGLIKASDAALPGVPPLNASMCQNNTLNRKLIKGKIVVCVLSSETDTSGKSIQQGGASGIILINQFPWELKLQLALPATVLPVDDAKVLIAYFDTEKNPTAKISPTQTVVHTSPAPTVARFSTRGPNTITPDIIKPDITAPGVQILAAWPSISIDETGGRSTDYNIISGTSMACPHVSGVPAIIKSVHPSWSPSAIKSAIMTTATVLDNTQKPILGITSNQSVATAATPFDYGSGHINPIAALDPGLVYEFDSTDIIQFLCSYDATPAQFFNLTGKKFVCKKPSIPSYNFNYPSIGVVDMKGSVSVHRTVTYYGKDPTTVYAVSVNKPEGVDVVVRPSKLKFGKAGEKKSFKVDFKPYKKSGKSFVFGDLTWSNGIHNVRSPIGVNVLSV
uniref:Subtilisin-like protease SBT5.3 n=1 Tax=Nelumbo nucifera TaxID=4432 RepID=A0A822Y950_NELNU|nr:TPA_asm: hypothetical protein HUJ06_030260 [Nelumbo nucifera]